MKIKRLLAAALAAMAAMSTVSTFAMSTAEFDNGMRNGINYFNRGLYYEARDEFQWFCDYNWGKMNSGQQQYALDYLGAAKQNVKRLENELFDECYNAYKNVLLSLKREDSTYKFTFAYINDDNIPDIFVTDGSYYAAGVRIYIYQNGMANKVTWTLNGETYDEFGSGGQIEYAPKSNIIKYGSERAEFKGTRFTKITGSKAEEKIWFLIERTYDPLTEEFVDSKYSISNKEVSKEEYMSQFNKTSNNYKWCETPDYDDLKNIDTYTIKNELEKYFQ